MGKCGRWRRLQERREKSCEFSPEEGGDKNDTVEYNIITSGPENTDYFYLSDAYFVAHPPSLSRLPGRPREMLDFPLLENRGL